MNPSSSRAAFEAAPAFCEGRIAIFLIPGHASRVRVVDVHVTDDLLHASVHLLPTPGLNSESPPMQISAHRGVLRITRTYWTAAHAGWQLFFDPAVVARVVEIVAGLPEGQTYLDDYTTRPSTHPKLVAARAPGPVATQLMAYLREQTTAESGKPEDLLGTDR